MKRGDVVVCVISKDYGKPRPAVVVQSDLFNHTHHSITVCPITSDLLEAPLFRLTLEPSKINGIKKLSQIMVDKISAISKEKIRSVIGKLTKAEVEQLNHAIALWLHL